MLQLMSIACRSVPLLALSVTDKAYLKPSYISGLFLETRLASFKTYVTQWLYLEVKQSGDYQPIFELSHVAPF